MTRTTKIPRSKILFVTGFNPAPATFARRAAGRARFRFACHRRRHCHASHQRPAGLFPVEPTVTALDFVVTPGFFQTTGISLLRGRTFTRSRQFNHDARRHGESGIRPPLPARRGAAGKTDSVWIVSGAPAWSEIVGIVGNVKVYSESTREAPEVYESFFQHPVGSFSVMVRTASDPAGLSSRSRGAVAQVDAEFLCLT